MKQNELHKFISFVKDENAQAMVEYVLLLALFVAIAYPALNLFVSAWRTKFNKLANVRAGAAGIYP